jgi:hypothetical protein
VNAWVFLVDNHHAPGVAFASGGFIGNKRMLAVGAVGGFICPYHPILRRRAQIRVPAESRLGPMQVIHPRHLVMPPAQLNPLLMTLLRNLVMSLRVVMAFGHRRHPMFAQYI